MRVFGIRHHGPGSARSLKAALAAFQPDLLLVEGPPEASGLVEWAGHPEMQPPVALLVYSPEQPRLSAFFPYATFSPEWQALQFGLAHGIPLRFIDLPQAHQLALQAQDGGTRRRADGEPRGEAEPTAIEREKILGMLRDPLGWAAQAAGYSDGESWWEQQVEQRRDASGLFAALLELMAGLRGEVESLFPGQAQAAGDMLWPLQSQREAWMRQAIRAAQREGARRLAVVCGAWHAPALADLAACSEGDDEQRLRTLPSIQVEATWAPWTYGRLAWESGYGAGVASPGWYDYLWSAGEAGLPPHELAMHWLARAAHLFRAAELDISPAHIIEASRLAEALAALRGRPQPGLPELNEAAQAVFCLGEEAPLRLVHAKMIVGERLGQVPEAVAAAPLQADLARWQKRLRLPAEAERRDLDLDLRKPADLERSLLLHRLLLLDIPWGQPAAARGKNGTFHELWRIQWQPELSVAVIEAGLWGNTVLDAAGACARHQAGQLSDLPALTGLVGRILLADLRAATGPVMQRLENVAALTRDTGQLMDALPSLAETLRYGNVRGTDAGMLAHVLAGLMARICIGLPPACSALDREAAGEMLARLAKVHSAVILLNEPEHLENWLQALRKLAGMPGLHGLLAGHTGRILLDRGLETPELAARRMSLALSPASEPGYASDWVEGFLKDSGSILLHDPELWQALDEWVGGLKAESFIQVLPLLRRTFSTFTRPERRQLGELAQGGPGRRSAPAGGEVDFDSRRAETALPVLRRLLGVGNGER